jgi:hypothetical protein
VIILVVILAVGALGAGFSVVHNLTNPPKKVGLTTVVTARRGGLAFTDDFNDPHAGWKTKDEGAGTFSYSNGGFTANAPGNFIYHAVAPYDVPIQQIGVTMTATIAPGAPQGASFGPNCDEGTSLSNDFHYEFLLTNDSRWFIVRHQGVTSNPTLTLKEGSAPVAAGTSSVTVTGMCATQGDGHTTRLVMFVNGTQVADITDSHSLPTSGWVGAMSFGSLPGPVTVVTATEFTVRNLVES